MALDIKDRVVFPDGLRRPTPTRCGRIVIALNVVLQENAPMEGSTWGRMRLRATLYRMESVRRVRLAPAPRDDTLR